MSVTQILQKASFSGKRIFEKFSKKIKNPTTKGDRGFVAEDEGGCRISQARTLGKIPNGIRSKSVNKFC